MPLPPPWFVNVSFWSLKYVEGQTDPKLCATEPLTGWWRSTSLAILKGGLPISATSLACGMLALITHNYLQVVCWALAVLDTTCFNSCPDTKFLVWLWICATIGSSPIWTTPCHCYFLICYRTSCWFLAKLPFWSQRSGLEREKTSFLNELLNPFQISWSKWAICNCSVASWSMGLFKYM